MREPVRDPQAIPTPEAQPRVEEMRVLEQTEGGRNINEAHHEIALQQVQQLRNHLEAQKQHLESSRGTLRKLFDQVRDWWKKEEGLETAVARLAIEMDHVEDKIKLATPEQLNTHLQPELARLQQQIEKIQLASVEVDQFVKPQEELEIDEPAPFPVEQAGGMKDWRDSTVEKFGKLGKYGQDCIRTNVETGTSVIADGMSTGVDSYEVARRATRRAQDILEDIPLELCSSIEEIKFFVKGELNAILHAINALPKEATGGTTLLAARYLEKFDAMVMIDIGDCEMCAVAGVDVLPIKTVEATMKTPPHIGKIAGVQTAPAFKGIDASSIVQAVSLSAFRQAHPGESVHVLLTTDGLKNNTGKTLEQLAPDIVAKGVKAVVAEAGTAKDDISILDMTIPAREVRKEAAA